MFRNCIYGGKLVSFGRIFRLPDRMRCGRALLLLVSALCTAPGFAVGAENFPSPRSEASAQARKATSSVQNGISVTGSIVDEDGNPIAGVAVVEKGAVRTYEQRTTIRYQVSEISAFYPDCW